MMLRGALTVLLVLLSAPASADAPEDSYARLVRDDRVEAVEVQDVDLHTWFGLPFRVTSNGREVFVAVTVPLRRWDMLVRQGNHRYAFGYIMRGEAQLDPEDATLSLQLGQQSRRPAEVVADHVDLEHLLRTQVFVLPIGFAGDRAELTWGVANVTYSKEIELRRARAMRVPAGETRCVKDWFAQERSSDLRDLRVEQRRDRLCASASLFGRYRASSSLHHARGTFRHHLIVEPAEEWGWLLLIFAVLGSALGFLFHCVAARFSRPRYLVFPEDPRASFRDTAKPRLIAARMGRALKDIHPRFARSTLRFATASSCVRLFGREVVAQLVTGEVDLLETGSLVPIGTVLHVTSDLGDESVLIADREMRDAIVAGATPFPTIRVVDVDRARLWPAVRRVPRPSVASLLSLVTPALVLVPMMLSEMWPVFGNVYVACITVSSTAAAITFTSNLVANRRFGADRKDDDHQLQPRVRTAVEWRAAWMRRLQ